MMWTKEQLQAINTTGVNITVSASAGAGKTAVLVERLMKRIIKDKISVDKIVALTFTEAAAAEMKNRLMRELSAEYQKNPTDAYLKEQITLLPSAKISTIHSFCLSILKDYYYILQIDPTSLNNILKEATITKIKNTAFDYVINNFDQEKLETTLYNLSSSAMNLDSLKKMVQDLSTEAFFQPDPIQWLDDSIFIYDEFATLNDLPPIFLNLFWNYNDTNTKKLSQATYKLDRIIDDLSLDLNVDNQKAWISDVISNLSTLESAVINQDYKTYKNTVETIASIKHKTVQKQPEFKEARDIYFDILNKVVEILYPETKLLRDLAHNKQLANNIIDIVKMYNKEYHKGITIENGITFNDMETLTYKLLSKNNNEVAKVLQNEIEDILVDEFQDTNTLQNQIIELVGRKDNIFRVGDVKQSIYRFRGAKPNLMQNLIELGNTDNHQTIFLSKNFRSKKDIVEYNNHLFSHLMNVESFESSYHKEDFVSAGTAPQQDNSKQVEMHLINKDQEAYEDFNEDYDLSNNEFKAEYISNQIVQLYNQDTEPMYNKFTVLVESHKNKEYLRQAFDKANIPYFIAMPDGFYDSYGVSTVHAYLKLILDPKDSISLTAILINLYGYSDNEITQLFLIHEDMFLVADALDKNILKKINYYNKNQNTINLCNIINDVLLTNNFYEENISNQSRTNLDLFYDSAYNYQQKHTGVYGFLLEIEMMKEEKTSEASSISSEDNVVNVMTIHNSKGLQFDTVFLWSKSLNRNIDSTSNYLIHPELGLALQTTYTDKRIIKDNLANFLIRYFDQKEALEEEMRKLYVAMTRAQNRLYIVDTFKLDKEKEYSTFDYNHIYNRIGYTGWIDAVSQNYPSKHFSIYKKESFEYKSLRKQDKPVKSIIRPDKPVKEKTAAVYQWPINPLNLSIEEKGFEIGTDIHNTIEKLPTTTWTLKMIKAVNPNISDYYLNKLLTLNQNSFFKEMNEFEVYKEYPFILKQENTYQRGIIDYFVEAKDTVYIVDFKTDNVDSELELIERYTEQLNFYKQAIKQRFKDKSVKSYLYSIHLDKFVLIK